MHYNTTPTPCNVCLGSPLRSGRRCICGGVGTEQAELQGLRERCLDLEAEIAALKGSEQATFFDFGWGSVPARRHRNPDGSLGGWVAHTAHVAPTATVDEDARVFGNATVIEEAQVLFKAQVGGDAAVTNEAKVCDSAQLSGKVLVCENAAVTGAAVVRGKVVIEGHAVVGGDAVVEGEVTISGHTYVSGGTIRGG